MFRDIVYLTVELVWIALCFGWAGTSAYAHRKWFGRRENPVSIAVGILIIVGWVWSVNAAPAVVSFTLD